MLNFNQFVAAFGGFVKVTVGVGWVVSRQGLKLPSSNARNYGHVCTHHRTLKTGFQKNFETIYLAEICINTRTETFQTSFKYNV